jgi:hypothetical protein
MLMANWEEDIIEEQSRHFQMSLFLRIRIEGHQPFLARGYNWGYFP